jgi:hypothetical protein
MNILMKCFSKGFPIKTAKTKPKARAMGEEINGVKQNTASTIKITFRVLSF